VEKDTPTIFIVDDEPVLHQILQGLLATEGYNFAFAHDGQQAIDTIADVNPDLILSDIMMPRMTGLQLCRHLREIPAWQNLPIILVTALNSKEDIARGLDAGANDFINKPFDRTELLARVRSMLRLKAQYDELEYQKRQLEATLKLREQMARLTARHLVELKKLHKVGLRLMSDLNTDSVLNVTSEVALELIPHSDRCIMHLLSDEGQQVLPVVFTEGGSKMVYSSLGIEPIIEQVIETRQPLYVPDLQASKTYALQLDDMRSLLVVPMFDDQRVIGTLSLTGSDPHVFEESHHHLLSILGTQATVAILKTRSIEDEARAKEQEKQAIRDLFGRYVSPTVVDRLVYGVDDLALGGKRHEVSVLFADIRGFTAFSETMRSEQLIEILNKYLALAVEAVLNEEGTLDKFMGDAVMALFNVPLAQPDHALRAVRTAVAMQQAMVNFNAGATDSRPLSFGIGIHVGQAVVGNIGTVQQMNYTAIGDTVNLAKRLQENAQGGQIILSQDAYNAVKDVVVVEDLGPIPVKGRVAEVHSYLLVDLNGRE
jgi:class 3 adenylate cyclase/DNA-binding response OmpR family regulator